MSPLRPYDPLFRRLPLYGPFGIYYEGSGDFCVVDYGDPNEDTSDVCTCLGDDDGSRAQTIADALNASLLGKDDELEEVKV